MRSGRSLRPPSLASFCALPPLLFLLAFFITPLYVIAALSLSGDERFQSYAYVLTSPLYLRVAIETLKVSLYVTFISLIIGYPLAYCMTKLPPRQAAAVIAILVLPWWTSVLVRSYAWVVILSPTGLLNSSLVASGLTNTPLPLLYNTFGVTVGTAHVLFPFAVLPIFAVMKRIDQRLLLAAQSLGANQGMTFLHVFVPLSLPGIFAGGILVFVQALGFFITPAILGGGRTVVISMLIETQVVELLNWKLAAALAILLLIVTLVLLFVYQLISGVERISVVPR